MVEGQNQTGRNSTLGKYSGGTVYLIQDTDEIGDSEGATEASNRAQDSLTTASGDWTISNDNTAGTSTLENSATLDFGAQSGYVHTQTVVEATDGTEDVLLIPETSSNDFTGEDFSYDPAGLTVTLGGE